MSAPSGELRSQQMLDDFLKRRNRALETLDIEWGRWLLQEYHGIAADRTSDVSFARSSAGATSSSPHRGARSTTSAARRCR